MKKVLVLTNSVNGLYNFRMELIHKLLQKNYEVIISAPPNEKTIFFEKIGCKCINTSINRRATNPISDIKLLFKYLKLLRSFKPDLVLTYTIKPNVYGGLACGILNIPYIANITGLGTAVENGGLLKRVSLLLYKVGLKKADCVFFQNHYNKVFFSKSGIVGSNVRLIPGSGVNIKRFSFEEFPVENGEINLLFIGRIMKAKGIKELIEAAKVIREKYPYIRFNIIGRCEENIIENLKEHEKEKTIKYLGHKNDVRDFIKNSHAIINPSHHEGMSNVLLEAASIGRPVLASNIPGCRETFDDNVSGIGFNAKDPDSLIAAIEKFIKLPYEKKKEMGIAGRKKMEKEFDRKFVVDAYIVEIDRILNGDK